MTTDKDRTSGYYNQELETLSSGEREIYLNSELSKIVAYAYNNAPAIQDKLNTAGILPDQIKSIKDLENIPITHKHELSALQQEHPPFGGFLGVPFSRLKRICMSPGPIYEPEDRESKNDRWTQAFFAAGFRQGDIGQVTFSYHLVPPAFWFEDALHRLGCAATPGGVGNTEQQVRMMRDLKVTGYIGTPSFLVSVRERAKEAGYDPKKDLSLSVGFVAGEMLEESLREDLESSFGMLIRQGYGTADVGCMGFECFHKNGMHVPYNCIVEIVDPETGKQLGPGETGEIVTTVFDEMYPLIRFGTGDLSYFTDEPCPCGRTTGRIVKILGRTDQVTKVKGMFIHPSSADEVMAAFPDAAGYQVVVTRDDHVDKMTFMVELKDGVSATAELARKIEAKIPECMRVRGNVEFVDRGTLPEDCKTIDDKRKWD